MEVNPEEGDVTILCYELLFRSAPEKTPELDRLFKLGAKIEFSKSQKSMLATMHGTACISEGFLQQIWLIGHAAWLDFTNFDQLKETGVLLPADLARLQEAIEAAESIGHPFVTKWPDAIPRYREVREGDEAKAVREIFAMATCWAILHEMKHAELSLSSSAPECPHEEELICDGYAHDFLFTGIAEYEKLSGEEQERVRGKRAIAALVGMYFVARLTTERASETHPPVQTRIRGLFDRIGCQPASHFWGFAIALMCGLRPEISKTTVELENPTSKDLAYLALDRAFLVA